MKYKLVIVFSTVWVNIFFSQALNLKIDSIKVYYLSNVLHTSVSLEEEDVRQFKIKESKKLGKENKIKTSFTITQYDILNQFCNINLTDTAALYKTTYIDCRCVLDIYFGTDKLTLSINNRGAYKFLGKYYAGSFNLNEWCKRNVYKN